MEISRPPRKASRSRRRFFLCHTAEALRRRGLKNFVSASPRLCGETQRTSGGALLRAAEFFQQPRHVGSDRVQRRRPPERTRTRPPDTLIEYQRISVRAEFLARF